MDRDNYTITIIQEENTPLAAIPTTNISNAVWVVIILVMAVLVLVTLYMMTCVRYRGELAFMAERITHRVEEYRGFNYFRLKEWEAELEQAILEETEPNIFLDNFEKV